MKQEIEIIGDYFRKLEKKTQRHVHEAEHLFDDFEMSPKKQAMYIETAKNNRDFCEKANNDATKLFLDEIKHIIEKDSNMINIFSGHQGSGKSRSSLGVIDLYMDLRKKLFNQEKKRHFTFTPAELQKKFPEMDNGDYAASDEWPKIMGPESKLILMKLSNLIDQLRATHKCCNICTPEIPGVEGISNFFVPFGHSKKYFKTHNPKDMKSRLLWYDVDELQIIQPGRMKLIGVIIVPLASTFEYWDEYMKLKMKNIKRLQEMRGASGISMDQLQIYDIIATDLYDYAKKQGWPQNEERPETGILETYLLQINKMEGLSTFGIKQVKNLTKLLYYKDSNKNPDKITTTIVDSSKPFSVSNEMLRTWLDLIEKESQSPKAHRNREIYWLSMKEGYTDTQICRMEKYRKDFKTKERVHQIVMKINGKVLNYRGKTYEAFITPILEEQYDVVKHRGGESEPDFELLRGDLTTFLSVKCMEFGEDINIPYDEHLAEIQAARHYYHIYNRIPKVKIWIYNLYNQKHYFREIIEEFIINEKSLEGKTHRIHVNRPDKIQTEI